MEPWLPFSEDPLLSRHWRALFSKAEPWLPIKGEVDFFLPKSLASDWQGLPLIFRGCLLMTLPSQKAQCPHAPGAMGYKRVSC